MFCNPEIDSKTLNNYQTFFCTGRVNTKKKNNVPQNGLNFTYNGNRN